MNKFLLVLATLTSISSFARGTEGVSPTMYTCEGSNGTSFHYSTTSKSGRPLVSTSFQGEQAKLPAFPEVRLQPTVAGSLVTVTDNHIVPVDSPTVHYSLLLPTVILENASSQAEFDTIVIRTSVGNPFFHGPATGTRVFPHNEVETVSCVAQLVIS